MSTISKRGGLRYGSLARGLVKWLRSVGATIPKILGPADACDTFFVQGDTVFVVAAETPAFTVAADQGVFAVAADLPAFTVPGCN